MASRGTDEPSAAASDARLPTAVTGLETSVPSANSTSINSHTSANLLRDWQNVNSLNSQTSASLVNDFNAQSPPVAPVVVLSDDNRRSSSGNYSYPVATFVREWVRTGMDHFSMAVASSSTEDQQRQQQQQHPPSPNLDPNSEATIPLSIRSEGDAQRMIGHVPGTITTTTSVRDPGEDGNVEFYVVDGELIEVPRQEPLDVIRERLREAQQPKCRNPQAPNRMRRGVRRLTKLWKRGVRKKDDDVSAARNVSVGSSEALLPPPSEELTTSNNSSHNNKKKEDKKTKRKPKKSLFSWVARPDEGSGTEGAPSQQFSAEETSNDRPLSSQSQHSDDIPRLDRRSRLTGQEHRVSFASRGSFASLAHYEDPLGAASLSPNNESSATAAMPNPYASLNQHRGLDGPAGPPALGMARGGHGVASLLGPSEEVPLFGSPGGVERVSMIGPGSSMQPPLGSPGLERATSVMANYVGTEDQVMDSVLEAGVIAADVAAVIDTEDYAYWKKDDGSMITSVLPRDADYKVDKGDAPDVEAMLMRAAQETTVDLDSPDLPQPSLLPRGKSNSNEPVPLSASSRHDPRVYNDMLKVSLVAAPGVDKSWVGRSLRNSQKRPRRRATLGVDVHSWTPKGKPVAGLTVDLPIKFMIWDVQSPEVNEDMSNFGAHPGTQSLFFSGQSLYLLVWDLACNNHRTFRVPPNSLPQESDEDFDEDEDKDDDAGSHDGLANAFAVEEANRKADRFLLADIHRRVLSWVDMIAQRGVSSAILPVVITHEGGISDEELGRRCHMLKNALVEHVNRLESKGQAPKLLSSADSDILTVDSRSGKGFERLQETVQAIATDASRSVFDHVGTPVPKSTVLVLELVRRFKDDHKLILLDYLLGEIGDKLNLEEVTGALTFLSNVGEILYFGTANDDVLSRYIVLSRKWLVSALSCILRNDLKRELEETRRFMNMQCIYSTHKFSESEVIRALSTGTYNCPLLSDKDAEMLWQSMSFMREASDHYAQLAETSTSTPTMFYFLQRLLVHSGVFLPLEAPSDSLETPSEVFFVPSLLAQADPREVWTYKTKEAWMTTLCHSWLFRDGAPPHLMEDLTVTVLREIYKFSRSFRDAPVHRERLSRSRTVPLRRTSMDEVMEDHDDQAVGRVRIHQVACWNSSLVIKMGTVFADHESGDIRESFVEIFVSIVDQTSGHCVATDAMRASMNRVIVSGKGQVGHHGRKLWKGGYEVVLNAVREMLKVCPNVDFQAVCPECLARSNPLNASTWSWDSMHALAQSGSSVVRCMRGHRLDSNLICGTAADRKEAPTAAASVPTSTLKGSKSVEDILPSVVLVGLWDGEAKRVRSVGSGFVMDRKLGLIATAGHVLFNMEGGSDFGTPYFGLPNAKVVIGVIPEQSDDTDTHVENEHKAVWRYFGELVCDDIHSVDACIIRIKTRMETDVDDGGDGCKYQPERILARDMLLEENLKQLKMTTKYELEESVRVLGFNQGGDGISEKGKHVNRSADFAKGYIVRRFVSPPHDDSSSEDSSSHKSFSPREEIVIICPTIPGHSGGPCVNDDGRVLGILSRADPFEKQRCYLVPSSEIKILASNAKKICSRQPALASLQSL